MIKIKLVGGSWNQKEVEVQEWVYTLDTPVKENKKEIVTSLKKITIEAFMLGKFIK